MTSSRQAPFSTDKPTGRAALGAAGILVTVGIWQTAVVGGLVQESLLPPASDVGRQLVHSLLSAQLWQATGLTLLEWMASMLMSTAVAVPIGLILGRNPVLASFSGSTIDFGRSIPGIAMLPLFVIVLGSGPRMVIVLAAGVAAWPLLIQTIYGARAVEPAAYDTARIFRFGRCRTFLRVTLPAAMPLIATGLRLAATAALLVAVGSQLIVGSPGLGDIMTKANEAGRLDTLYAICVWTGVLGWALNLGLKRTQHRYLAWHASTQKAGR